MVERLVNPALWDPADRTYALMCEKVVDEQLSKAQMLEVYDQLRKDLIDDGMLYHPDAPECHCQERFDALRPKLIEFHDSLLTASVIDELYRKVYQK